MIRLVAASLAVLVFVATAALPSILCLLADHMGYGDPPMLGNGDVLNDFFMTKVL